MGLPKPLACFRRATSITENRPAPRHCRALPRKDKQAELHKATQDREHRLGCSNTGGQTAAKAWGLFLLKKKPKPTNPNTYF